MKNIQDNFVPYKESVELKELGFDKKCLASYYAESRKFPTDIKLHILNTDQLGYNTIRSADRGVIIAPLWQQAFEFFREKYNLYIEIDWYKYEWYFVIYDFKNNLPPNKTSAHLLHREDKPYESYEEAQLECLRELIKIVKK